MNGAIEFGNRMLTFLVTTVALLRSTWPPGVGQPAASRAPMGVGTIVPAQVVIGGITVLTDLNP